MSSYAAFLRGMNVGGHRLTNQELCAQITALGFREVASFRASGNVVFAGEEADPEEVRERNEVGLERLLGYAVPCYIRGAEEVAAIASARPFPAAQVNASAGKLQVGLLHEPPPSSLRDQALELASSQDRLSFGERELYWLPSGPMSDSELDLKLLAKLLGAMTLRTKGTIEQIAAKHFSQ